MRRGMRRMMRMRRRRRRRRIILAGSMIAWGSRKMKQSDVQKVEQTTGKSYEDLSDEEVQKAVTANNIQTEPMTPDETAQVEKVGATEEIEEEVPE